MARPMNTYFWFGFINCLLRNVCEALNWQILQIANDIRATLFEAFVLGFLWSHILNGIYQVLAIVGGKFSYGIKIGTDRKEEK